MPSTETELLCIGLSHHTAPLAVRERLAVGEGPRRELVERLARAPLEAVLLSTCNRVELYLATTDAAGALAEARAALAGLGGPEVLPYLRTHRGRAALAHLFRVASSLDSVVVGEPQVLGQLKQAFEQARAQWTARQELLRPFAAAFRCAKRVRTETAIGRSAASMASAAVALAGEACGGLAGKAVLVVGAGAMGRSVAQHAKAAGAGTVAIANRTRAHADALAAEVGGVARPLEELVDAAASADVVLCSTAAPAPLFDEAVAAALVRARRFRPLVMVDLAVPRAIAPGVGATAGLRVLDVDDVQAHVLAGAASRSQEAEKARALVEEEVDRYLREAAVRASVPVLSALRRWAEATARAELERTLSNIGEGLSPAQRQGVEALSRAIVNKLLHGPSARLREAGADATRLPLAAAAAELFGLEGEISQSRGATYAYTGDIAGETLRGERRK